MMFSPRISRYFNESILPSTLRFPVAEDAKQPQSITRSPPCLTVDSVFFSAYASFLFLQTYKSYISLPNRIPSLLWLIYLILNKLEPTFLELLGVRLGVLAYV